MFLRAKPQETKTKNHNANRTMGNGNKHNNKSSKIVSVKIHNFSSSRYSTSFDKISIVFGFYCGILYGKWTNLRSYHDRIIWRSNSCCATAVAMGNPPPPHHQELMEVFLFWVVIIIIINNNNSLTMIQMTVAFAVILNHPIWHYWIKCKLFIIVLLLLKKQMSLQIMRHHHLLKIKNYDWHKPWQCPFKSILIYHWKNYVC